MRRASVLVLLASCGRIDFGPPVSPIGCADGEREGLLDAETVAACGASWAGPKDLRHRTSGRVCGDDRGDCVEAADACGAGWHICANDGHVSELLAITGEECGALVGRYVAASSHCETYGPCTYADEGEFTCKAGTTENCIQPICCGDGCDPNTGCADAVWPGRTRAASFVQEGCAQLLAVTGVLCCRD